MGVFGLGGFSWRKDSEISMRKDIRKRYRCCGVSWASHKKRIWEFPPGRVSGSDVGFVGVVEACLERNIQVFFIRKDYQEAVLFLPSISEIGGIQG